MSRGIISITSSGSTKKTESFLKRMMLPDLFSGFDDFGQRGVEALRSVTPVDSGITAASWGYEVETKNGNTTITWFNTHTVDGVNVAVILQYGHGTGTGGYVTGKDFINPAIKPIFDDIADEMWKKVTSA